MSESTDSDTSVRKRRASAPTGPGCPVPHTGGIELLNKSVNIDIDKLFDLLFTDSDFQINLHNARKTTGMTRSSWQQGADEDHKTRKLSYTVPVNSIFAKAALVTETQVLHPVSQPGKFYAVDVEIVNSNVPYADTFYVTVHYCLTSLSSHETKIVAIAQIKFKKSTFVKGKIQSDATASIKDFFAHMERALQEECHNSGPTRAHSVAGLSISQRRVSGRPRRQAPQIPPLAAKSVAPAVTINGPDSTSNRPLTHGTFFQSSLGMAIFIPLILLLISFNASMYVKLTNIEGSHQVLLQAAITPARQLSEPPDYTECLTLITNQANEPNEVQNMENTRWRRILACSVQLLKQAQEDLNEDITQHLEKLESEESKDSHRQKNNGNGENENTKR